MFKKVLLNIIKVRGILTLKDLYTSWILWLIEAKKVVEDYLL
jgi:hypothetical protein